MEMRMLWNVIVGLGGAYLVLIAALYVFQRSLMYQPGPALPDPRRTLIPQAVAIDLKAESGGRLVSWYIEPAREKPVILYFQGNAGTIADRDFKANAFAVAGFGVWLTGYRGFGGNGGSPTEEGLYADAWSALDELEKRGVRPADIVLYGESLGTGVAVEMASRLAKRGTPVLGVVLEAPFKSMGDAAQGHYPYVPAKWLVRDKFDSAAKISAIEAPLLIMHGDRDRVVPEPHGRALFEAAVEPKQGLWIPDGGHSNLYDFGVGPKVVAFISGLAER